MVWFPFHATLFQKDTEQKEGTEVSMEVTAFDPIFHHLFYLGTKTSPYQRSRGGMRNAIVFISSTPPAPPTSP
jgi:hypothetical protein